MLLARSILILVAIALFCFSAFGFLASFELAIPRQRLPWQIGYGCLSLVSFYLAQRAFNFRRSNHGNSQQ